MSFDLSRVRFDARRDFLGVVMQQGRVQLDSDWNEWVAELARRIQAGTLDTFGGNVVPRITPNGFLIEAAGGGLSIGPGRIYVDGLLAENHGGTPDAWDPRLAELAGISALDYANQPYYPDAPALPDGGPHLVYVDVWQRDVNALQAPDLVEAAVGVDTTGRLQTVWQVKFLADVGAINCATPDAEIPGWSALTAPSAARLSTATGDPAADPDPCEVPPDAGYLGLENQLYRVEVHAGGALGSATFKWSRDNATVATAVTHINPARDRITVASIGRDDLLRFHDGDWVEITDDWLELNNRPGELRRVSVAGGVDEAARSLSLDAPLSAGLFPTDGQQATDATHHTRVRRWDQAGPIRREDGTEIQNLSSPGSSGAIDVPATGTRLFLEHGILVEFDLDPAGGEFRSGDYWVFAARSANASIEELVDAPPRGIHHHYARLALVNFPDAETDCRTLWPPLPSGEDCACTICVQAETHNNGSATIQQAIDTAQVTGGTICLGPGVYNIDETLNLNDLRALRIQGQGWATMLIGRAPRGIINITDSTGITLENFTVMGSATTSGDTAMIELNGVIDIAADQLNVLGLSANDGTSMAFGLNGIALGVGINDCVLIAEQGIAALSGRERNFLVSGEMRAARNLYFCSQRGVSFERSSLHFGATRITDSLMLIGNQAAVVAQGGLLDGSAFSVADNVIFTEGDGIRSGLDRMTIDGNEITGIGERSGNGILLEEGLMPDTMDHVRITDNRLARLGSNAIEIRQRIGDIAITGNNLERIGLAALVMSESGAADYLDFSGNSCLDIGQLLANQQDAFAALQLVRVQRGDIRDNQLGRVALQAVANPAIDALRAAAVSELRVAGNRFFGIGPDRISAQVSAIRLQPPFDRIALDDNSIDRVADAGQSPVMIDWRAILILPDQAGNLRYVADVNYYAAAADFAYLISRTRVIALPAAVPAAVSIRGNRLRGHSSAVPLTQCLGVDDCLFAENRCELFGEFAKEPLLGALAARTVNVSNNRLIAQGDLQTLHLQSQIDRVIVIGNTSSGGIQVIGGITVPSDLNLTNIIGV